MTQPIVYLHEKVIFPLALCKRLPAVLVATKTASPGLPLLLLAVSLSFVQKVWGIEASCFQKLGSCGSLCLYYLPCLDDLLRLIYSLIYEDSGVKSWPQGRTLASAASHFSKQKVIPA